MSKAEVENDGSQKKKLTEVILELSKQLTDGAGVSAEQLQKIIDGLNSPKSNIAEVIAHQEGLHKYVVKSAITLADKKVKSKAEESESSSNTDSKDQKDQVELTGSDAATEDNHQHG